MATQAQNLSREMTLYPMRCVSYLIGTYLTGTAHPANSIPPRNTIYAVSATRYEIRDARHELNVQNEPNLQKRENHHNSLATNKLRQYLPSRPPKNEPKTNPNEPKRTQNKPNFWPVRASQSQNEPKRTQNEPNLPKTRSAPKKTCNPKISLLKSSP
jgi:hypothetical protein